MEYNKKPLLDTATLSDEELIELYENIPYGASSSVYYNDGMKYKNSRTSERAIVIECAKRFVEMMITSMKSSHESI